MMRMRVTIWAALGVGGLCLAGCGNSMPAKGGAAVGSGGADNLVGGSTAGSSGRGGAVAELEDPAPAESDSRA
jgi:hypothetical protein